MIRLLIPAALLLFSLSACPPPEDPPTPDAGEEEEEGEVAGQLTLAPLSEFSAGPGIPLVDSAAARQPDVGLLASLKKAPLKELFAKVAKERAALQTPAQQPPRATPRASYLAGELLVRPKPSARAQSVTGSVRALKLPGVDVRLETLPAPARGIEHLRVKHADGSALTVEQTVALAQRMEVSGDYLSVEPNRRVYPAALPNDTHVGLQWHLSTMSLPEAWDLQTDAADVVVAVLDTGIIRDHPDLSTNVLPGADLISDPDAAGDGDGRDQDPTDMGGDGPSGSSSWHGSHVAGTIGANTNNNRGIAGVAWRVGLVPVRVLGVDGGTLNDIIAGVEWAIGKNVSGLSNNANPADVINMSLGGDGAPSPAFQAIVDEAVSAGVVFAVAAGNDNEDTASKFPCNQQRVICVGATKPNTRRASYSNYGAEVDVMAPGGEVAEDQTGDGYPDGVLSTGLGSDGSNAYLFYNGTSMATPHVAGLLALMKQARHDAGLGGLNHDQAVSMLTGTAISGAQCSEGCGAGLVNAHGAILAARGEAAPTGPGRLSVAQTRLTLRDTTASELLLSNYGGDPVSVTASFSSPTTGLSVTFPDGDSFTLEPGTSRTFKVQVTAPTPADGGYTGQLVFTPTAGTPSSVEMRIRIGPAPGDGRDALVLFMFQDALGEWDAADAGGWVTKQYDYKYLAPVPPGEYIVVAAVDEDGNGEFLENDERYGFYPTSDSPEFITVERDQRVSGIDFTLVQHRALDGG